jgi:hypothetical protein
VNHTVNTITPTRAVYGVHEQILDDAHAGHDVVDVTTFADAANVGHAYCEDCHELYARVVLRSLEPPTS